jgi:hypothetical protein
MGKCFETTIRSMTRDTSPVLSAERHPADCESKNGGDTTANWKGVR